MFNEKLWRKKYKNEGDNTPEDMFRRNAKAIAANEKSPIEWEEKFYEIISNLSFIPAGRILSGAGSGLKVSLNNCYVISDGVPDDMAGIFETLKESALTMQSGGGIGLDFSTLRPKGAPVKGVNAEASGPISFMRLWDAQCETIMSAGTRRGAQMGVLRCDHPDIEEFITAKRGDKNKALKNFNLSVAVTDNFINAVKEGKKWDLKFNGKVYKTVKAVELWNRIMRQNYDYAEPGVLFIDKINEWNNLYYHETLRTVNPCGEQPLPAYSACCLGSINLTKFINNPFTDKSQVDFDKLAMVVGRAVRFLDNVVDISWHPLEQQRKSVKEHRRIGLGVTGLANAMAMLCMKYGSDESLMFVDEIMATIRDSAYEYSTRLAEEKGAFPLLDKQKYLAGKYIKTLPDTIRRGIELHGIRNSHLLTVAPTGTTSLLVGNISSGVEPILYFKADRKIKLDGDTSEKVVVDDYAVALYKSLNIGKDIPEYFVDANTITPDEHIDVQSHVQKYIDASISKTINLPNSIGFEGMDNIYLKAYDAGIKGCTIYRAGCKLDAIITNADNIPDAVQVDDKPVSTQIHTIPIERPRPSVLDGKTYKIKTPNSKHALYVTITNYSNGNGSVPYEIFLNTKDPTQIEFMMTITRLISAIFRRERDNPSFVVEELRAIHSPTTGFFDTIRQKYCPSIVAQIGEVINDHLVSMGIVDPHPAMLLKEEYTKSEQQTQGHIVHNGFSFCPECGERTLRMIENCRKCLSCGYSKC